MEKSDARNRRPRASTSAGKGGRYAREAQRKAARRKQNLLVVLTAVLLLMLVVLLCMGGKKDGLKGQWRIDEITAYRFDGKGKGALILPEQEFSFRYTAKEDQLYIDFNSESVRDFTYTYEISGRKLLLIGGEGKELAEYVLMKE